MRAQKANAEKTQSSYGEQLPTNFIGSYKVNHDATAMLHKKLAEVRREMMSQGVFSFQDSK